MQSVSLRIKAVSSTFKTSLVVKLSITVKSNWQITWICIEGTLQRTNIALINFSWDRHDQWKPHYSMINQRTERNRETDRQSERDRQTQTNKQRERERERDDWLIVMISISYTMTCLVFENNKLLDLDWLCSGNLACHRNEREYIFEMVDTFDIVACNHFVKSGFIMSC